MCYRYKLFYTCNVIVLFVDYHVQSPLYHQSIVSSTYCCKIFRSHCTIAASFSIVPSPLYYQGIGFATPSADQIDGTLFLLPHHHYHNPYNHHYFYNGASIESSSLASTYTFPIDFLFSQLFSRFPPFLPTEGRFPRLWGRLTALINVPPRTLVFNRVSVSHIYFLCILRCFGERRHLNRVNQIMALTALTEMKF